MNEFITIFGSILLAFLLGSVAWFFLLRGFITKWLKARRAGRVLLLVLRKTGLPVFRVAEFRDVKKDNDLYDGGSGFWEYILDAKTDRHVVSFEEGCVIRIIRVNFGIVFEGDTAAVNFRKVVRVKRTFQTKVKNPESNKEEDVTFEQEVPVGWEGWNDSGLIANLGVRSSQKPKIPTSGLNLGMLGIIAVVAIIAVGGFFLVQQLGGDEAPAPAAPVVPGPASSGVTPGGNVSTLSTNATLLNGTVKL